MLRGFESGKGIVENLRDTIVNIFKTMVLRPIISAVVNPLAGAAAHGRDDRGQIRVPAQVVLNLSNARHQDARWK